LEPVIQDDLPKRWSALRDRLVQLLECMGEAHAHNAFHGTLGYPWLFKVPGTDPLQLCVEGWFLNGTTKIPTAMERLMVAPECAADQTLHPNLLPQMDLYSVGYLAWRLACGQAPRSKQSDEPLVRFAPRFSLPSGFAQWMQDLLSCDPFLRPRSAAEALDHLFEVDRVRRSVPPQSVARSIPNTPPEEQRRVQSPAQAAASCPLLANRRLPLVGREEETHELWRHFRQVQRKHHMQLVVLRGAAGTGKSRLAEWLFRRVRATGFGDGLHVRHSAARQPETGLIAALRRALQTDGLNPEATLERCQAWLRKAGEHRPAISKLLAAMLRDGGGMTPQQRQQSLHSMLAILAERQPLILWLDDLHWGDESLDFLIQSMGDSPIPNLLVLATVRDEALVDRAQESALIEHLLEHRNASSLKVNPLDAAAMRELTEDLLHLAPQSAQALMQRSEGNPLFAIQWVAHAINQNLLQTSDEGMTLSKAALKALPADAQKLCIERTDGVLALLPPSQLEAGFMALGAAAVLGSPFRREEWLGACARLNFDEAAHLLNLAKGRQVIRETEGQYTFAHGLLREALIEQATEKGLLVEIEEACGEALLDAFHAGSREVAGRLYDMLKNSGRLKDALAPLLVEADRLHIAHNLEEAQGLLREAQDICDQLQLAEADAVRVRLLTFSSELSAQRNELVQAFEQAEQAEQLAQELQEPALAARARLARAFASFYQGKFPEALEDFGTLTRLNQALESPRHQAQAMVGSAMVQQGMGELQQASELLNSALTLLASPDYSHNRIRAHALRHLAGILQIQGSLSAAQQHLAEALQLENRLGNQPALLSTMAYMGDLCTRLGRPGQARTLYQDAADGLATLGSAQAFHPTLSLAYLTAQEGDLTGLEHLIGRLETLVEERHSTRRQLALTALKCWLAAQAGDWSTLDERVLQIQELFASQPNYDVHFAWVLGDAALRAGRRGQARRAVPMLDVALRVYQHLNLLDQRRELQAEFLPLERL
jgi:tetratricopeptide (TPR) repeat protein